MERLLTTRDIAETLQLSTRHVAERVTVDPQYGFPEPKRIGNTRRWKQREFEKWLERQ